MNKQKSIFYKKGAKKNAAQISRKLAMQFAGKFSGNIKMYFKSEVDAA